VATEIRTDVVDQWGLVIGHDPGLSSPTSIVCPFGTADHRRKPPIRLLAKSAVSLHVRCLIDV